MSKATEYHYYSDGYLFIKHSTRPENGTINVYKIIVDREGNVHLNERFLFNIYGIGSYDEFVMYCKEYSKLEW
jgi:hypothetical protein